MPPQAARMSCYSVAEEITPVCADFLVVDAVPRNQSPLGGFPGNTEKNREKLRNTTTRVVQRSEIATDSSAVP
jgi:hypothetical protein